MTQECLRCGRPTSPDNAYCTPCYLKLGYNIPKYPSHQCQRCGADIGWIGRFFDWIFGDNHNCASRQREKKIP